MARFPFGRPSCRREPRRPAGRAALVVLGVYPSALHVRWTLPDWSATVGALAVDDEPEVFWDGADAARRIDSWKSAVGWTSAWGTIGAAGGNGSSGRHVAEHVLRPLGVAPADVYFTDCLPTYFVKNGQGSQGERIRDVYDRFAAAHPGLCAADLPPRPREAELIRRCLADERDALLGQLTESRTAPIVTLGREAAYVLAGVCGADRVRLRADTGYGQPRAITVAGVRRDWIPLTHPGNHTPAWTDRHAAWVRSLG
ncbi:MAG: hypothetical protein NTW05_07645 [Pseudonocardiales bacterium]|jgi:hypothetical protein|nr:hypothetical protein [Pseudonocardiales bacterium]